MVKRPMLFSANQNLTDTVRADIRLKLFAENSDQGPPMVPENKVLDCLEIVTQDQKRMAFPGTDQERPLEIVITNRDIPFGSREKIFNDHIFSDIRINKKPAGYGGLFDSA
ncbi:MAG: hypothetical protein C4B57_06420 [Deltaproteobacteria bacterium]|nr:MAG: hypothetical protein C4B57_06420 [Deltaproteobacteria bacterium]